MSDLEKLNTLCAPKQDYGGRAFPSGNVEGVNINSERENQNSVPEAPKAFQRKPMRRGGNLNDRSTANAE
jgi:hypothetical protein